MAGRFGADVTSVGSVIQLVTNGILIGEYRPDDARDEVDIRVRFPDNFRVLDQLDNLRVQTPMGLVPISNFVKREARPQVSSIERINGFRRIVIKANTALDPETGTKINVDSKVGEIAEWLSQQQIDPAGHHRRDPQNPPGAGPAPTVPPRPRLRRPCARRGPRRMLPGP